MSSSPHDTSPNEKNERDGASTAFYVFVGALALSLLTLLGTLVFV